MRVPTVGSVIKIRVQYGQGPRMIPPQPDHLVFQGKVLNPHKWLNDRQFCLTGGKEFPVRVIDIESVVDLKIITGDSKNIDTEVKTWEVSGSKNNKYVVSRNISGWTCTCPGFQFRKQCKHIAELSGTVKA